mmetsp:Transcript_30380/g.98592  ORF Transcript_30380/g.98592 Transcript_30380/m.98592 type:complete len:874 (+) Transcript_30380:1837-4458(+)
MSQHEQSTDGGCQSHCVDSVLNHGQLIIAKTHIGQCVEGEADDHGTISLANSHLYNSVYINKGPETNHRQWLIFDQEMVLPEYLVSFDYIVESGFQYSQVTSAPFDQNNYGIGSIGGRDTLSEQELVDYAPFLLPLVGFLEQLGLASLSHRDKFGTLVDMALGLSSRFPQQPNLSHISEEAILARTRESRISEVTQLNLHGLGICRIEMLDTCSNLQSLSLSCNNIRTIEGLVMLQQLTFLDLSFNLLSRVTGLVGNPRLQTALLNNNSLNRLDDLNIIRSSIPGLVELDLRGNSLTKEHAYRSIALLSLSTLKRLDGKSIQGAERESLRLPPVELTINHIRFGARKYHGAALGGHFVRLEADELDSSDTSWLGAIKSLSVNHAGLARLRNLEGLTQLCHASFSHNLLLNLDGLSFCTALEDLLAEDNRISACTTLEACRELKKLDLSHNQLSVIRSLESLRNLTQLSLENNFISSLASIAHLTSLMELYMGNNDIEAIQEIDYLKHSPKLIIMDLSGNRLCASQDYRLYVLFRLRRLKVLDGTSVLADESNLAREKFSGKLTREFLFDRLEHASFASVCQLEISSLKLRDLSILCELDFFSLYDLNAENNHLCDFGYLGALPALNTLRLGQNRVGSFSKSALNFNMDSLEVLHLANNRVSDINDLQLHRCPHLKELQLQNNYTCYVGGFDHCSQLLKLDTSKNRVRQVPSGGLIGLSVLRELRMEEAGLRTLANLAPLKALNHLHLAFNRINDIGELEKLAGVGFITEITLCNNPIARRQLYRPTIICQIPSICWIDGRDVGEEERERAELFLKTEQPLKFFWQDIQPSVTTRLNSTIAHSTTSNSDSSVILRRLPQRGAFSLSPAQAAKRG